MPPLPRRVARRLWDDYRLVVEHGAATAVAALWSGRFVPEEGTRVAVILCGANASPGDFVAEHPSEPSLSYGVGASAAQTATPAVLK